ncbi:methyltransferase-like protein 23 isoform X1 [Bufo gargarizans]|uniref:methyltransferase-like protein 23 isoform X1 n=1 Tax=Bufo gargarizans TaxID=30331 RepID=UPI001CF4960A|nr:methyltransferase-like protein 23 isoform X1 [Bufo gargarizans]
MSGGERRREPLVLSREYVFLQDEGGGGAERSPELRLRIPEVLDSEYGMYVWPCAPVLAQYIWFHRASVTGKRVLEVGAGVSLPGIVAAKCGANVILSDSVVLPQCLENCFRSCAQNNLTEIPVIGLTWGEISPDLLALPPIDIILGSDVFYEPKDFEDVLVTVHFIMERNPSAEFWTSYQVRSANWSIESLLHKWHLRCLNIPLKTFNADGECLAGSKLPGRHSIQMMVITLKRNLTN